MAANNSQYFDMVQENIHDSKKKLQGTAGFDFPAVLQTYPESGWLCRI